MFRFDFVIFCEEINLNHRDWLPIGYMISILKQIPDLDINISFYEFHDHDRAMKDIVEHNSLYIYLPLLQANYCVTMEFLQQLKKVKKESFVIIGDREATHRAEKIMEIADYIDCIIIGEPERTIVDLVQRMNAGNTLKGCKGIIYREDNGIVVKNDMRECIENLNELPFPDRSYIKKGDHRFGVSTSRGCAGHCTFCERQVHVRQGMHGMRSRSMENVLDEIEMLIRGHGARYIFFQDDTFCHDTIPLDEWCRSLYDGIIRRNFKLHYFFLLRSELVNEKVIVELKKLQTVGLDYVLIGIESGNAQDLKLYGKIADLPTHEKAIKLLEDNGIFFDYGFIMFNPYSTFDNVRLNIDFLERNKLPVFLEDISKRILMFSGSPLVKKIYQDGLLNCDIDMPILDQYAYSFQNTRIEDACNALKTVLRFPCSRAVYMRTLSLYYNAKDVFPEDDGVADFYHKLINYAKISSEISISLIRKVIDVAENSEDDILDVLSGEFDYSKIVLKELWDEIEQIRIRSALMLRRKGQLFI